MNRPKIDARASYREGLSLANFNVNRFLCSYVLGANTCALRAGTYI